MIKIRNITKTYSKETVLKIDYLDINSGQTFGLVGNNGARMGFILWRYLTFNYGGSSYWYNPTNKCLST